MNLFDAKDCFSNLKAFSSQLGWENLWRGKGKRPLASSDQLYKCLFGVRGAPPADQPPPCDPAVKAKYSHERGLLGLELCQQLNAEAQWWVQNERGLKLVLGPPQAPVSVAYRNSAFYMKLAATSETQEKPGCQ